ncbi:MAG: hypothetical protein AB8G99_05195 [Planctomycetaceae bacterium]
MAIGAVYYLLLARWKDEQEQLQQKWAEINRREAGAGRNVMHGDGEGV